MKSHLEVLSRFQGLTQTGPEKWKALCPAHEDHRPSLQLEDYGDRLLLHCFTGCSFYDIAAALNVTPAAFFDSNRRPDRTQYKDCRQPSTQDLVSVMYLDLIIIRFFADYFMEGRRLDAADWEAFQKSLDRLFAILRFHERAMTK